MTTRSPRIFLLSPATLAGVRGTRILAGRGKAPFVDGLHRGETVPLGDVYAFISSLYFRGKRAYAERFGRPGPAGPASRVITPARGIVPVDEPVGLETLRRFASEDVSAGNPTYVEALSRSATELAGEVGSEGSVVLLGSVASGKYVEPLVEVLGRRLLFPRSFVGRGDMSRGGLLLRAVDAGEELDYVVALDAERTGTRPPRLEPRKPGERDG